MTERAVGHVGIAPGDDRPPDTWATLGELARFFLFLGTVAIGGPAAHIAMMEEHTVRQRGWLTREGFLDLLGAANLIPGPSSTELAIFIGFRRAGWRGLVVAGVCFILPAFLIVTAIAWAYRRFGTLPAVAGALYGIKPVVIAVVLQALRNLGPTALKTRWLAVVALCALVAAAMGVGVLPVLGIGALLAVAPELARWGQGKPAVAWPALAVAPVAGGAAFGLWPLLLVFLKVGAVLYGSGYVLLAFLQGDLVQRLHWLTEQQLLDAVAVGQVTPGPVFTTATFIGYVLGGLPGAVVATVGIFLPSFAYVAASGPLIPRIRRSPIAGALLSGVTVASLALMAVVSVQLGRAALVDSATVAILIASLVLLVRFRVNSAWLVLGGALLGSAAALVRHTG
jgi:chromate transporter